MVGQDYNCFILSPISSSNLIQPMVTAAAKNIPFVAGDAFDEAALKAAGVKLATYVTVRHTDAGKAVAEDMVKRLGGTGKVALIGGLAAHPASIARLQGFRDAARGLTIVRKIAPLGPEKALNAADAVLRSPRPQGLLRGQRRDGARSAAGRQQCRDDREGAGLRHGRDP